MVDAKSSPEGRRAQIILAIEWVLFTLVVIGLAVLLAGASSQLSADDMNLLVGIAAVAVFLTLMMVLCITVGVVKENSCACITWYVLTIIGVALQVLGFFGKLANNQVDALTGIITILMIVYRVYSISVIIAFNRVLNEGARFNGVIYNQNNPQPHYRVASAEKHGAPLNA